MDKKGQGVAGAETLSHPQKLDEVPKWAKIRESALIGDVANFVANRVLRTEPP